MVSGVMLAALLLMAQSPLAEPDCAAEADEIDRLICDDPGLRRLDRELADLYQTVHGRLEAGERVEFARAHRQWLAMREGCTRSWYAGDCVKRLYRRRLHALRARSLTLDLQ